MRTACGLDRLHNSTYTACNGGPLVSQLPSTGMSDFPLCWLKHLDDLGALPPVRAPALLVTRPEAARMLSISVAEIDNLRRAGRLLAKRHGGKVLFPLVELKRYAESLPWEMDLQA